ncbi:hypothetical protein [Paenarthrobacter nicotinovorans]|uniref:hypothetical protein n=1 Tax=Paenarthrobacter nicotinovorans TaxID=29320 RepID=UPI0011A73E9F|nr:hypothetical protein [Paenarthrobacter nicotinovorans]
MASARETVRFFTMSRKFPKLIGRMYDGSKIWGGPYTTVQFTVMGIVAVAGFSSKSLWSTGFGLIDLALSVIVAWLVGFLAGMLPIGARSPAILGLGLLNRLMAPAAGTWDGSARRPVKPRIVAGAGFGVPERQEPATNPEVPVPRPDHASLSEERYVPEPAGPATGLERLLAQTGSK